MGLKQGQDKRIQCIYWNVYIGKITKHLLYALFTPLRIAKDTE